MAITTAMCTSFKSELLGGIHDLDTHTIKLALIKSSMSGTYNAATTNYSDVTLISLTRCFQTSHVPQTAASFTTHPQATRLFVSSTLVAPCLLPQVT